MRTDSRLRVGVVGGGIGGVAAALALSRAGVAVEVFEQADELREIGAGLQLGANAVKALRAWGLEEEVAARSVRAESVKYFDLETGSPLFETPLGARAAERYGAPLLQIHRADLLDILVAALPDDTLRVGAQVAKTEQDDDHAAIVLATGERSTFHAVVGADGYKSNVRTQLFGEMPVRFTGTLGWRLMLSGEAGERLGFGHSCYCYLGRGRSIVVYYLRSGELLNVIGFVPAAEVQRESWTKSGDIDEFRASFAAAAPALRDLIDAPESAFITGVFDRDPTPAWTVGRATLLGDAAHPLAPYLAQGACQAIEDAAVLASTLGGCHTNAVPAALTEYEQLRRPRATKVQMVARAAEQFWHQDDEVQIRARNGRFRGISRLDPLGETVWAWLFDYDPVTLSYGNGNRSLGAATVHHDHQLQRPEAQRVLDAWRGAITPLDLGKGWLGIRAAYARFLSETCPPRAGTSIEPADAAGVRCLWVTPAGASEDGPVVLYLHGGGYIVGSADAGVDVAERLGAAVGGRALAVDYRLAPEEPFPAALDDAVTAYRWLTEQTAPANIVVAGDSAGGGLAVAMLVRAREDGLPMPAAVYAMSPFADLALRSSSIDEFEGKDPAVSRDLLTDMSGSYLQGHDPEDPLASPVYAELSGLPPLMVHAARTEALRDDSVRLVDRATAHGVSASLRLFDDTVHVFPLFNFAPDTDDALAEFAEFARINSRPQPNSE